MIWTLFGMSFMYVLFIVPIVVCNVFNIEGNHYLICYTLYWFQVNIDTGWLIINMHFLSSIHLTLLFMLQDVINTALHIFVI